MPPPPPRCWPGLIVSSVVPSAAMRSFTAFWAPVPSATTAMTAPTPITMPSIVSAERSLFARNAPSATLMISPMSIRSTSATAAAAAAATTAATRTAAARARAARLPAQRAGVLPRAVLLRLTLRLERERAEHDHSLADFEPAHDLGVVEIALGELHDAGMEDRLAAVRGEHEAGLWPRRTLSELVRGRQLSAAPALAARRLTIATAHLRCAAALTTTACASRPRVDVERGLDRAHLLVDRLHLRAAATAATTRGVARLP